MRKAFTLIELLIVIAIIAILIGILLPVLRHVKDVAKATDCLAHHQQIGAAVAQYANAYKDYVPREGVNTAARSRPPWAAVLRPFLDENATYNPEVGDLFANAPYLLCKARELDNHKIHYVVNGVPFIDHDTIDIRGRTNHLYRRPPTALYNIWFPSDLIYMAELRADVDDFWYNTHIAPQYSDMGVAQFYDLWDIDHFNILSPQYRLDPVRHYGTGTNTMFFDGHASYKPKDYIIDVHNYNDRIYNP